MMKASVLYPQLVMLTAAAAPPRSTLQYCKPRQIFDLGGTAVYAANPMQFSDMTPD